MSTGLKVPVTVDGTGGAAIETDKVKQKQKLLFLAFSENNDQNPFQSLGVSPEFVFAIKNSQLRAKANLMVRRIMSKFVGLMELSPSDIIDYDDTVEGEVTLSFKYVDLETNTVEEFKTTFGT